MRANDQTARRRVENLWFPLMERGRACREVEWECHELQQALRADTQNRLDARTGQAPRHAMLDVPT